MTVFETHSRITHRSLMRKSKHDLASEILRLLGERETMLQRAAQFVAGIVDDEDSEIAEEARDAFNDGGLKRPMTDRLRDWGFVVAQGIRSL